MRLGMLFLLAVALFAGSAHAEQVTRSPWSGSSGEVRDRDGQRTQFSATDTDQLALAKLTKMLRPTVIRNQRYQCVPYARAISGVQIRGNAWSWWGKAAGLYRRGAEPRVGSVMVFKRIRSMRYGHIAMVSEIVNERLIRIDHANWVSGEIHRGALVRDISPNGDWSRVRVWYPPIDNWGSTHYPIYGFIYPERA